MILAAFRRGPQNRNIHVLYGTIVAQARSAAFYTDYGIPDTVEGRFELIVLHLVLVLDRLRRSAESSKASSPSLGPNPTGRMVGQTLGQRLFDVFCRDLDHNLREMGVGDMAVSREMRRFGEAFYGRQAAYCAALAAKDQRELEMALSRNIFADSGANGKAVRLARYVRAAASALGDVEQDVLAAGKVVFPRPETFVHE